MSMYDLGDGSPRERELPAHLAKVRDAPDTGPSSHTLERRKQRIMVLEQEQSEIFALMEDLHRVRDHIQTTPVVGKVAIPIVSIKIREMRQELGRKVEANRTELNSLKERT